MYKSGFKSYLFLSRKKNTRFETHVTRTKACPRGAIIACWLERRARDRKLRVRVPAGAAGEFFSPELTLCADSYSVSVPPPCYRSGTQKTLAILPKVQMAGYI